MDNKIDDITSSPTFRSLLDHANKADCLINSSIYDKVAYLNEEEALTANLSFDEIKPIVDYLNPYPFGRSLSDDIKNINAFNPHMERLFYLLTILFNHQLLPRNDAEAPIIFRIKSSYFVIEELEIKLRNIYLYLLDKHIEASAKKDQGYIDYLTNLKNSITIKYYGIKTDTTSETVRVNNYTREMMINNYLDALIMSVISQLLAISDKMIEDEIIYAYAISYQLLLRSLFILMNDPERLIMYESVYQGTLKDNTISHNIIRMAFISYSEDLKQYNARHKMKIFDGAA